VITNRQELDERLVDYLYDELSEEEANRFEAAVVGHPDLEAEVAAHRRTRDAAASLSHREMSPAVMAAVMAEARAAVAPALPQKGWFESLFGVLMQPAMMTAMLLFVVGGTSVFVVSQQAAPDAAKTWAADQPMAAMAEEAEEPAAIALAAKAPAPEAAPRPGSEPAGSAAGRELAGVDKELSEAAGRGSGSDFKPVSPAVARLVEVDGAAFDGLESGARNQGTKQEIRQVAKAARPAQARLAARSKKRSSKAGPLPVARPRKDLAAQLADADVKRPMVPSPSAKQPRSAAKRKMVKGNVGAPASARPVVQARAARKSYGQDKTR